MSDLTPFSRLLTRLSRDAEPIRIAHSDNMNFRVALVAPEHLDAAIDRLNAESENVWFEVNPSAYAESYGRSSAHHVTRLAALWADLDYKDSGLGGEPGAWAVIDDLSAAIGTQPAIVVHSGNGLQPYWPILDGAITEENRDDIAMLLKRWGVFVQRTAVNNGGAADGVFDLPRILRVPGTVNVKDRANPKPATAEFRDTADIELDELRQMLLDYEVEADQVEIGAEIISPSAEWEWAERDCDFAHTALAEILSSSPASRHHWALKWSALIWGMVRSGCVTEEMHERQKRALVERFQWLLANEGGARPFNPREMEGVLKEGLKKAQQWSKQKLGTEMRSHIHADFMEFFTPQEITVPSAAPAAPASSNVSSIFTKQPVVPIAVGGVEQPVLMGQLALQTSETVQQRLASAQWTDTGNAEKLGQWLQGRFIWVPDMGWHEFHGTRWKPDNEGRVVEAAKDMFVHMTVTAPDDFAREFALKSLSKAKLMATIELSKTIGHLVVQPGDLDANGYEMNTPGGIVDLRTGTLRPFDPTVDFHTKQTAWTPDRRPIPRFLAFMQWAMSEQGLELGAQSRVAYLQRLFGLAAIGRLLEHVFPIFIGVGANGKSTLLDIMLGVFGAYGAVTPRNFLMQKRNEAHPTEIADLRGVRLSVSSEVPPTAAFDEDLVKQLTGETRLKARFMGKDFFWFENMVTAFLAANHLPAVRVGGSSFWRRARKIEFQNVMPLREQNKNLAREILEDEGPGILQWVIDGAIAVQQQGLGDPTAVMVATKEYQMEEDIIARFIQAHLVEAEGIEVDRETVFEVYKKWMFRENANPLNFVKFCREIITLVPRANLGDRKVFTHLRLAAAPVSPGFEWMQQ